MTSPSNAKLPRFERPDSFHSDLKEQVNTYFTESGLHPREDYRFHRKAILIALWAIASYIALVFFASNAFTVILSGLSLGLAIGGIGFSVAHDGAHGSSSRMGWANRIYNHSFDFIGTSSSLWRWKHNVLHHGYTNVTEVDSDIDNEPFLRLSPYQESKKIHRYQKWYAWILYTGLVAYWQFYSDLTKWFSGRVGAHAIPERQWKDHAVFWGGKLFFFGWAFVLPSFFHPILNVVLAYFGVSAVLSLVMSAVFQIAHCVEYADFTDFDPASPRLAKDWARHQAESSIDFGSKNPWLRWYCGGLTYQIEHHLFPNISHVHYEAIAPIVEKTCREHGVRYQHIPNVWAALQAHGRWLARMGEAV